MFVHCCHCAIVSGRREALSWINALIETDRIALLAGELRLVAVSTDSGRPHRIFRCATCQTAIWSEYGGIETLRFVRVGTLDDPAAITPNVHIYVRSNLPWVTLPEGVPQLRGLLRLAKALACCQPETETRDSRLMYRSRETSSQ
jgi:hypothetical protein